MKKGKKLDVYSTTMDMHNQTVFILELKSNGRNLKI